MSSRTGSSGSQPPQPGKPASSNENDDVTNTENVEKEKDFCRDFIWGACIKGAQCKYRHELEFELMKKTLKFCHDFQNSTGCTREHCTYLHATKEEQSLFKATGQLPQVLAQRHANMSAAAAETIPQIALYIQESLAGQPPPPPPPLPPVSGPVSVAPPPAPASIHPRPPVAPVVAMAPRPIHVMQQPPPPPPPPTVPAATTLRQRAPVFTAPPPFGGAQPPLGLPMYDASKPPPPILPTHAHLTSASTKRQAPNDNVRARPTKIKKREDPNCPDALCEQCVQKELRIEAIKVQLEAISEEEEYQTMVYKKMLIEYQNLKEILKSLISTDIFQKFLEENVEETPQNQFANILNNQPAHSAGVSQVPNQFLLQLLDYVMTDRQNADLVPSPSVRIDESLVQALSVLPRKTNPVKIIYNHNNHNHNNTNNNNAPPEVLQTFMELLRQFSSSDRSPPSESNRDINNSPSTSNNTTNTSNRQQDIPVTANTSRFPGNSSQQYSDRQQDAPVTVNTSRFPANSSQQDIPTANTSRFPANTSRQYSDRQPDVSVTANTSRVPPPTAHAAAPSPMFVPPESAPPPYEPYPSMPPPAGLYYAPPYAGPSTGVQMAPNSQAMRAHVPPAMAAAPPPPAPFVPPAPFAPPAPPPMYPTHYAIGAYPAAYCPRHQ